MSDKLLQSSFQGSPSYFYKNQSLRNFLFEGIGTMILAIGVCCTGFANPVSQRHPNLPILHDLYISLSLYLAICFFAPFTGGHFNQAVSLGVFCNKHNGPGSKVGKMLLYWAGQLLGAIVGCVFSKVAYNCGTGGPYSPEMDYETSTLISHWFGEFIGTFFFVFFILIVTTPSTSFITEDCWIHLFIPICLFGGRKLSKSIGGLNPCIILVLQVLTNLTTDDSKTEHIYYILILCAVQLLGAFAAAMFFSYVYHAQIEDRKKQED